MYQGHYEDVYVRGQPEHKHRVMPVVHTTFYVSLHLNL
jgi:hypothetical protein